MSWCQTVELIQQVGRRFCVSNKYPGAADSGDTLGSKDMEMSHQVGNGSIQEENLASQPCLFTFTAFPLVLSHNLINPLDLSF